MSVACSVEWASIYLLFTHNLLWIVMILYENTTVSLLCRSERGSTSYFPKYRDRHPFECGAVRFFACGRVTLSDLCPLALSDHLPSLPRRCLPSDPVWSAACGRGEMDPSSNLSTQTRCQNPWFQGCNMRPLAVCSHDKPLQHTRKLKHNITFIFILLKVLLRS